MGLSCVAILSACGAGDGRGRLRAPAPSCEPAAPSPAVAAPLRCARCTTWACTRQRARCL